MIDDYKLEYLKYFSDVLNNNEFNKLFQRIERVSCKIAPLNLDTGNTQTVHRWELNSDNPHYASERDCLEIFKYLIEDLLGLLQLDGFEFRDYLKIFSNKNINERSLKNILSNSSRIGTSEIPIWYKEKLNGSKHESQNIYWFTPFEELYLLRGFVESRILTKIQVKAYLTDRRQTGEYCTNRELRWETHPNSPQFASKTDCMLIEAKLIAQIFSFSNAPEIEKGKTKLLDIALGIKFEKNSFRCPISGKQIDYNDFYEKVVTSPVHGRSGYQIGHIDPLSKGGFHNNENVSWITELGNRIQGESSLDEITNEIFQMATFHKKRRHIEWKDVEELYS